MDCMGVIGYERRDRPPLWAALMAQLQAVEPSIGWNIEYRPCEVTLLDGSVKSHVYVQSSIPYYEVWGIDPEDDSGKSSVLVEEIAEIHSSPYRLPPALATRLYSAGESGMGYCVFKLVMKNGQTLDCLTGNAVDFLEWPEHFGPEDVADVVPGAGSRRNPAIGTASYSWALYD
jgi:hypothetical protein